VNLTASCAASRPCIGDILLAYAVLGVGLLFFVSRSNRTTLIGAAIAFAGGIFLLVAAVLSASNGPSTGIVADPAALDTALRGGFVDAAIGRLDALPSVFATLVVLNWFPAFGMFLLGLVAGRRGVLAQPQAHTRLWRGLLVGTIVALRPPARIPPAPPAGRSCSPADDQARVVVDTSRHGPQRHGWERP